MNALETLIASGIPQKMAERIIAQAQAEPKQKKAKGKYFPGMSSASKKVPITLEVTIVCECCGAVEHETRAIMAHPDSPTTQKTQTMLCNKCPDMFRALTHEQLVSLCLVRHHAGIMHLHTRDKGQIAMAKQLKPEEVITYKTKHF